MAEGTRADRDREADTEGQASDGRDAETQSGGDADTAAHVGKWGRAEEAPEEPDVRDEPEDDTTGQAYKQG